MAARIVRRRRSVVALALVVFAVLIFAIAAALGFRLPSPKTPTSA